jgi:Domain of unknown function (DUF4268)
VVELSRLESVDPRAVWSNEAHDFTPWLLQHHDDLAETLGIDLKLERAEEAVGSYSLDLIGRDLTHDAVLMVENQLEVTDHSHLGQVLTYAAGTGAATIVWIARAFREEHRQALDWLNESTIEDTRFFGIVLRAVRIADSPPAPLFEVVAKPNDWGRRVKTVARATELTGRSAAYADFWRRLVEAVRERHPQWTRARAPSGDNWLAMPSPLRGTSLNFSFAQGGRLRSEIYIDAGDAAANDAIFGALLERRDALEASFGRELDFEELPGRRACRVAEYTDGMVEDGARHEEFIAWFIDSGERFRRSLEAVA